MPNTVTMNVKSDQGFHKIFLQQDVDNHRTIHALVDKVAYPITSCSSASGTSLTGLTVIKKTVLGITVASFTDAVALTVDPVALAVTMVIVNDGVAFSGILDAADATELVAFIKACNLPSLAE